MSTPQDAPSTSPPAVSSSSPVAVSAAEETSKHQAAADKANEHLDAALAALAPYDHPHHADRLKAIGQHVASLKGWISALPGFEVSRADHEDRVMDAYRNRKLDQVIPEHDEQALRWGLEKAGK